MSTNRYPMLQIATAPADVLEDVMGRAMALGEVPEEGIVALWLFCIRCANEEDASHLLLWLHHCLPQHRIEPEMTHVLELVLLKEPFQHIPLFTVPDLMAAWQRILFAVQFEVEGAPRALLAVMKELAQDLLSGVLTFNPLDSDVWQQYVDYYGDKYSNS